MESLTEGLGLGRELALVVSFRQLGCLGSGETFSLAAAAGEDAVPGEDFWKKEKMDRCFEEEADAEPAGLAGLAGVRAAAAPPLSPAMMQDDFGLRARR